MQVRDKNMIDLPHPEPVFPQLDLRTLPAVNKKKLFIELNNLGGWEPG
jgi:hypothetical protein